MLVAGDAAIELTIELIGEPSNVAIEKLPFQTSESSSLPASIRSGVIEIGETAFQLRRNCTLPLALLSTRVRNTRTAAFRGPGDVGLTVVRICVSPCGAMVADAGDATVQPHVDSTRRIWITEFP